MFIKVLLSVLCLANWSLLAAEAKTEAEDKKPAAVEADALKAGTAYLRLRGGFPLRQAFSLFEAPSATRAEAEAALRKAFATAKKTVVLDCAGLGVYMSSACAESFAAIVRHQKKDGQHVVCLIDNATDGQMILAAACDEVVCNQAGFNSVDGIAMYMDYYTDALKKIGITFHAVTSGPQKTAPEFITRSRPSEAAIAEMQKMLQSMDDNLLLQSQRADLTPKQIKAARELSPQTSAQMVSSGLADKAVELGAWHESLERPLVNIRKKNDTPDLSSFGGMMQFWGQLMRGPQDTKPKAFIAVLELEGTIVDGASTEPGMISDLAVVREINKLKKDKRVKAILLRVNSPGGSATASDRIYHALKKCADKKPMITLIDDVAASGGYYIACATPRIIAHNGSITGSIGVFSIMPDLSQMRADMGVHRHVLSTNPRAQVMDTGAFGEAKQAALLELIKDIDQRFKGIVSADRKIPLERVDALANGRVYMASEALGHDLIDGTGTYADALAYLQGKIEGKDLQVERYPAKQGLASMLGLDVMMMLPPELRYLKQQAMHKQCLVFCWKPLPQLD